MKNRKLTLICSIGLVLVLVLTTILAACAQEAAAPGAPTRISPQVPAQPATPATPTAPTPAPAKPAPAPAAEVIKWRYADIYARESAYSLQSVAFVREVERMSDGLIDITYFATGELIASGEIIDGITKGMVEIGAIGMGYATGLIGRVQHLDCGGAAFLSPFEAYGMLYDESGEYSDIYKVVQKYYNEIGIMPLPSYLADGVDWCYSTEKVEKASDLIGLPYRTSGMTSEILTTMGAATVWLPWEELYTALQMGTVEACEWGSPDLMYGMGLQEVCKYWRLPGIWNGFTESKAINLEAWNETPDNLQGIVKQASQSVWLLTQATSTKRDVVAVEKAKADGVTIDYWTAEDLALFASAWKTVMEEIGTSGEPYTAELFGLIKEYRQSINQWPE